MTQRGEWVRGQPVLGTMALAAGAVLLVASFAEAIGELPVRMPRFWYVHRELWWLFSMGLFLGGCVLLARSPDPSRADWQPRRGGRRFRTLVLYTREGCSLCDKAHELLVKHAAWLPEIREVDIDGDPSLVQRFGTCVPVIEIDGKLRFRGRLNEHLLRRHIDGTPPLGDRGSNSAERDA